MTSPPLIDASEANICNTTKIFSDTPSDAWFAPHVCVAKKRGMIGGYPDGTFRPEEEISFAEAAKIISSFYAKSDDDWPASRSLGEGWYKPFVRFLEFRRAIPASIRKLSSAITRGEMSEMIYRLQDKVESEERGLEDFE